MDSIIQEAAEFAGNQRARKHAYGRSCLNCVSSKTRCARAGDGQKCERCARLNKDCQPAPVLRRRRTSRGASRSAATLEEKLDGIVELLQRSQAPQNTSKSDATITLPPTPATSHGTDSSARSHVSHDSIPSYPLEDEAELAEYLETYRTKIVQYSPFVCIQPGVTVQEMQEGRPFLWSVIRSICSRNLARQGALVLEIKKALAQHMLLDGTKNMDLLLGVLVLAAMGQYYIDHKPIMSTIVQLAVALACDLGVTSGAPQKRVMLNYNAQGCPNVKSDSVDHVQTLEARRGLLGLFFVSSITANFFRRIEGLRWTPYMEQCLRVIEEREEYETDKVLVYLIRVQLIVNKSPTSSSHNTCGDAWMLTPHGLHTEALNFQLQEVRRSIPLQVGSNPLQLHLLNASLSIHEHALGPCAIRTSSSDPTVSLKRLDDLWACCTAAKSLLHTFVSDEFLPIASFPHISLAMFTHMAHSFVALYRLSTFEAPGILWDQGLVSSEIDVVAIATNLMERLEAVRTAAGSDGGPRNPDVHDPWGHLRDGIRSILNRWKTMVATKQTSVETQVGLAAEESGDPEPRVEYGQRSMESPAMNLDFFEDVWMRDMLAPEFDFSSGSLF